LHLNHERNNSCSCLIGPFGLNISEFPKVCCLRRPKWEGGEYDGEDETRFEALMLAMELGAEYVDIELKVGFGCVYL
jgi:hypothetical protein